MTTLADRVDHRRLTVLMVFGGLVAGLTVLGALRSWPMASLAIGIPLVLAFGILVALELRRMSAGWVIPSLLAMVGVLALGGLTMFWQVYMNRQNNIMLAGAGLFLVALAAATLLFLLIEYGVLRLLSLSRVGAIVRVTYYEALLQPFTLIIIGFAVACVAIFAFMPFFTLSEDAKMYRDVGASFCLLFTLPVMIFAASKVVDEEIENRTMLTLMSKPVSRWQVIIGKYLGVVLVCFVTMAVLGLVVAACAYVRYFDDMRLDYYTATIEGQMALNIANNRAVMALIPALILQFLQIATLASVAVAISTRWGLAFNVTAVSVLYVFANLTQFVDTLGLGQPWQSMVSWTSNVLPHLNLYDLNQRLIYGSYRTAADIKQFVNTDQDAAAASKLLMGLPTWSDIWQYVGLAFAYALCYIGAMLSAAVALFRTRELT